MMPQGAAQPTPPPGYMGAVQTASPYTPSPVPGTLERPASNRGKMILAGLGAVALGVAVFVGYKMMSGKSGEETRPAAAAPTDPTTGKPVSAGGTSENPTDPGGTTTPAKVKVDVASNPTGAEVFVSDVSMGKTPVTFELDRGDKPVELLLKADGFEDRKESVVPNTNSNLDLQLKALKVAGTPDGEETGKTGSTSGQGQGKTSGSSSSSGKKTSGSGKKTTGSGKSTSAGDNTLRPAF